MTNLTNLQYPESSAELFEAIKERILIIDGAMGTMIQNYGLSEEDFRGKEFSDWDIPLKGCNDILALTRPDVISDIHTKYLNSGADIIETNSFNANAVSLADYRLESYVDRINYEAARLARKAADDLMVCNPGHRRWVAGSMGPTGKSLSMADDIAGGTGAFQDFDWDKLVDTYTEQASALIRGGVDLLLIETAFDTLNAKAAVFAVRRAMLACLRRLPIIISTTLTESGRTLSGQTPEAFIASIAHAEPLAVGLNCGFGAKGMIRHLASFRHAPFAVVAYPNAGLPNAMGEYDETPESMATDIDDMLSRGLVNLVGGCCGSTPAHIAAITEKTYRRAPRQIPTGESEMVLSGLEPLTVSTEGNFLNVGERCNVAGSRKFLRLIKEGAIDEAVEVAESQIEAGARVIDINMDDSMLDAATELPRFLRRIGSEPEIARVPVMIDSSRWDAIEASLKCVQGHPIVNSLSLKEGEEKFIRKATLVKEYGASLIVMAFDENGQADTFERKIEICSRAYRILTEQVGFRGCDIVFDPNILTVATGIEAHDRYALDFINTVKWIKANLPGAKVSGGVSNLSFAFRGNNYIREAMHAAFLYHAIDAGLDMAIVNAANLVNIDDVDPELRETIDDVLLCRSADATERLIAMAEKLKQSNTEASDPTEKTKSATPAMTDDELIEQSLIKGSADGMTAILARMMQSGRTAISIIDGPLMGGMNRVGQLFGEGKMFLPQVVKSARAMKLAVDWLTPHIEEEKKQGGNSSAKMVIATVKGDVHDIGKNIVGVILSCNGVEVHDMGVMVPGEDIVDKAVEIGADFIGLSGLITPSLEEMCEVARIMQRRGLNMPLFVGGATTSDLHTAVKIAPCYSGPVFHTSDAASIPSIIQQYSNPATRSEVVSRNFDRQSSLRDKNENKAPQLTIEEARGMRPALTYRPRIPAKEGIIDLRLPIDKVRKFINWRAYMSAWKLDASLASVADIRGCDHCRAQWLASVPSADTMKAAEAMQLYKEAQRLVDRFADKELSQGIRARVAILPAGSTPDDSIIIKSTAGTVEISTPRQRTPRQSSSATTRLALSDFVAPSGHADEPSDWIGVFAVTAGTEIDRRAHQLHESGDEYRSLLYQTVAHRLAEAATEYLHLLVRTELWGYSTESYDDNFTLRDLSYEGIRPAVGYPSLPDQRLVFSTDKILDYASMGITLTENGAMHPSASTTGLMIAHPDSRYFIV